LHKNPFCNMVSLSRTKQGDIHSYAAGAFLRAGHGRV
jgi:hypothetical protein